MLKRLTTAAATLIMFAAMAGPAAAGKADDLVVRARLAVEEMTTNKEFGGYISGFLKDAEGVLIMPQVIKGAFLIGGEGGSGVLLTRGPTGSWSYPAFYTLGGVSYGLQVGGSASQVMLLLMTQRGVDAIVEGAPIKLGADIGAALGPVGAGAEAGVTFKSADVIAYSLSAGAFIGISLEGTVIEPRESLNKDYYGVEAGTREIVEARLFANPHADELRAALVRAAPAIAATQ